MDQEKYIPKLLKFLANSPTSFHTVHNLCQLLEKNGFIELKENETWNLTKPGSYFIRRNSSSLIAVNITDTNRIKSGIRMAGAHTDSPALKIKPNAENINNGLMQLGVEVYGGALLDPWFDRDLSIAGRLTIRSQDASIQNILIDFKRPVAVIPSLAVHLNREANDQKKINKQTDLVPIVMQHIDDNSPDFNAILLNQLAIENGIEKAEILDHELFLYDSQQPALVGMNEEFLTGTRLDNLLSCFSLVTGLIDTESKQNSLIVLNDHEEVGSQTAPGAQGPFLKSTLKRLVPDHEIRQCCLHNSLMISADNAHAVHPNFADRHDKNHQPLFNKGPVIKYNANQRYATTGKTASFYKLLARKAEVPVQEFVMRSDLACGSTIGPITAGATGVQTIDIGIPTLAMHSIREMAGKEDCWQLYQVMRTYFASQPDDEMWQCLAD